MTGEQSLLNRELSWLDFGARVLDCAEDARTPLLERAKFLAIFSQGLDEFFQVRVAGLKDQVEAGIRSRSPDGMTPTEQLHAIRSRVLALLARQDGIFLNGLVPGLAAHGILLSDWRALDDDDRSYLVDVFQRQIFPVLTPLGVDPGHPFPYISNLSLNLGVVVGDPVRELHRFARVKVPPLLPRFVVMPDDERFVPLEQVIAAHLDMLFPAMEVGAHHGFRVTRNADLTLEEDGADDLLEAIEVELRRRRFGRAVRLEIDADAGEEMRDFLVRELELGPDDVYETRAPVDLGGLWAVHSLDRPDLHEPAWVPITPPVFSHVEEEPGDLFALLRERDVLVQHPYESFATSVAELIAQAAADPAVLAIKQTLYRTSEDSTIISSLIAAAQADKQVAAAVELKARFDEQANIEFARVLEEAGVHVVYGLVGLKTHVKVALVVRREHDGLRRYCHIGTGNYNSRTARIYEDIGLLTSDDEVATDVGDLFNFLTGYSRQDRYRKLVVSPTGTRRRLLELIETEAAAAAAGTGGRIVFKVNGLTDPRIIEALYDASGSGVHIDLIVRGICCLRPGLPGLSENITVRSIVGQFLEHSRIYLFGGASGGDSGGDSGGASGGDSGGASGSGARTILIGSADLMERNLDRRVEALVPVEAPGLQERLAEILDLALADDMQSWVLGSDGTWRRVEPVKQISIQRRLQEMTRERARRRWDADAEALTVTAGRKS